jgi:hypothetical protein
MPSSASHALGKAVLLTPILPQKNACWLNRRDHSVYRLMGQGQYSTVGMLEKSERLFTLFC